MQYSDFTYEQIMSEFRNYQELCNLFFEMTSNIQIKDKLRSILYEGGYQNFSFNSEMASHDNPAIEIKRRVSMAYLLITNPTTFDKLVENKINLFHGTNANALPSILKHGLNSVDESEKMGINVSTGETWSRIQGKRNFVSFTDVLDIAEEYSAVNLEENNGKISFEVVIGTSVNDMLKANRCRVSSDLPEVTVKEKFPKEYIKMIFIPSDKVEFVKKITNSDAIEVVSMDNICDKFYYIDETGITISHEMYNELKNKLQKNKKSFSLSEIKSLMCSVFSKKLNQNLEGEQFEYEHRQR